MFETHGFTLDVCPYISCIEEGPWVREMCRRRSCCRRRCLCRCRCLGLQCWKVRECFEAVIVVAAVAADVAVHPRNFGVRAYLRIKPVAALVPWGVGVVWIVGLARLVRVVGVVGAVGAVGVVRVVEGLE